MGHTGKSSASIWTDAFLIASMRAEYAAPPTKKVRGSSRMSFEEAEKMLGKPLVEFLKAVADEPHHITLRNVDIQLTTGGEEPITVSLLRE